MNRGPRSPEAGLTLLEVMVASAVLLIIVLVSYNLIATGRQVSVHQTEIADMSASVRVATHVLALELREAGLNPAGIHPSETNPPNVPPLKVDAVLPLGTNLEMRADLNADGTTLGNAEWIRWEWRQPPTNGYSDLVRLTDSDEDGTLDETTVIASRVRKSVEGATPVDIFTFLDSDGQPITSTASIGRTRSVLIRFTVETERADRISSKHREVTVREVVVLRNLGARP